MGSLQRPKPSIELFDQTGTIPISDDRNDSIRPPLAVFIGRPRVDVRVRRRVQLQIPLRRLHSALKLSTSHWTPKWSTQSRPVRTSTYEWTRYEATVLFCVNFRSVAE